MEFIVEAETLDINMDCHVFEFLSSPLQIAYSSSSPGNYVVSLSETTAALLTSYLPVVMVFSLSIFFTSATRVRQAEEALPELPSCPAQVVRHPFMFACVCSLLRHQCFPYFTFVLNKKKRIKFWFLRRLD